MDKMGWIVFLKLIFVKSNKLEKTQIKLRVKMYLKQLANSCNIIQFNMNQIRPYLTHQRMIPNQNLSGNISSNLFDVGFQYQYSNYQQQTNSSSIFGQGQPNEVVLLGNRIVKKIRQITATVASRIVVCQSIMESRQSSDNDIFIEETQQENVFLTILQEQIKSINRQKHQIDPTFHQLRDNIQLEMRILRPNIQRYQLWNQKMQEITQKLNEGPPKQKKVKRGKSFNVRQVKSRPKKMKIQMDPSIIKLRKNENPDTQKNVYAPLLYQLKAKRRTLRRLYI